MKEQWQELKETIIEIRDNNKFNEDVSAVCKFLINYMGVLEKQMQEPCEYAPFTIAELKDKDMQKLLREFKNQRVEDAISRQAVLDIVRFENRWLLDAGSHNYDTDIAFESIISKISDLPPVQPKIKTGHWILTDDDFVYCSECEDSYYPRPIDADWYYCPHCGVRMVEPQESEV